MTVYSSVSVLTLIRGRQRHFDHLVAGLRAQVSPPDELVIAYMQPTPPEYPLDLPFAVNCVHVDGDAMALAKARNAAANAAEGEILAFLDVDCIADTAFVKRAREALQGDDCGVFLPEVRYLPAATPDWLIGELPDYPALDEAGQRHPAKPDIGDHATLPIDDFGELWGLSFILSENTWMSAGGMDEGFVGYGGEETDFAQRLRVSGAQLHWLGGTLCYHQHHPVFFPPLQHFEPIVRNAHRFHENWGTWCMDYWLDEFQRRGLIKRSGSKVRVIRHPTDTEIQAAKQPPHVRFS